MLDSFYTYILMRYLPCPANTIASILQPALTAVLAAIPGQLGDAMRYSTLARGKYFRSYLLLNIGGILGKPQDALVSIATALECLHTYSLIHDDLPAMDDGTQRRGQPTCHLNFDEATAILAGDGLLTYAIEILATADALSDIEKVQLITHLTRAAGPQGMVQGQMLDMLSDGQPYDAAANKHLEQLKTGKLIAFATAAPALLNMQSLGNQYFAELWHIGEQLGYLFQLTDDLLDVQGNADDLGKDTRQDSSKATLQNANALQAEIATVCRQLHADAQALNHAALGDFFAVLIEEVRLRKS